MTITSVAAQGHILRWQSCNMRTSNAITSGTSVMWSSMMQMIFRTSLSSASQYVPSTNHHTWLIAAVTKKAAVHWRSAFGGFTDGAMALLRLSPR